MNKTKIAFTAAVCCLLGSGRAAAQDFITEISTPEQLYAFATQVNNGTNYSGRTVTLTTDIDLSGYSNWTPIGIFAYSHYFCGTFNGQGHKVTNLEVNAKATETGYVAGLFGHIGIGGVVRDLTVSSLEVRVDKEEDDNIVCYVGAIAGYNEGVIVGCANRGVTVYGNWKEARVGGIAGENSGNIQNSYNLGRVYTSSKSGNFLGGIVGNNASSGNIKNCFVRASIDESNTATDGPICGNNIGTISGCFYMNGSSTDAIADLVLANNGDNSGTISGANGTVKNVLLDNRTIYSDGAWNTICLPFSIGTGAAGYSPIAGASVKELDTTTSGFNPVTGVLTLNFIEATSIEAGKPYIVKWEEAIADDLSNPVFLGVTVSSAAPATVSVSNVDFIGIYSKYDIADKDESIRYIGAANGLYYPGKAMYIGSCRAYFKLTSTAPVKAYTLRFEEDNTDGIVSITSDDKRSMTNDSWYDLNGRKLSGKPGFKGIYIHNGRKEAMK